MEEITRDPLVADIARLSAKWHDENKFTFIWKEDLILVHYDRERRVYMLLSDVDSFDRQDIYYWLYRGAIRPIDDTREIEEKND